jgi:DNA-binding NarL/FixJ family response regulator
VSAAPSLATTLGALGAQVDGTLDQVSLPMTLIDASRRIRWQNQASVALIGERRGSSYLDALAPPDLAPRLRQTLQLLASGSSTPEIAEALGVTTETARNYVRRLLQALGVHSRIEAVARGRETDLI